MLRPENAKALLAIATRMKQWINQGVNEFELKALSQQLTDVVKEESKDVQQKKIEAPAPTPVFDYLHAEGSLRQSYEIKLTETGALVYKKIGKFVPLTGEVISKFLRSYLVDTGQVKLFRRDLTDDFAAFIKAGL